MLRFFLVILLNIKRGPSYMITMRKLTSNPERYSEEVRYRYAQKIMYYFIKSMHINTEVYGLENLPAEGGYVMFPNHQGKYDVLGIIYNHKKPCSFVMDKAKSYQYFLGELIDMIDAKRLDLKNVKQNMRIINEIAADVEKGKKYIIFPEGGYRHNRNKVQEFKSGTFKCATKVKAPIVPVALIDSYKGFNSNRLGPVNTKVIFLEPLYYDEYKDMNTTEISTEVRLRIMKAMESFGVDPY